MKTKVEIINETVAYYSEDVNRRSLNEAGKCAYNGPDGKHCAFARVCQITIPNSYENLSAFRVFNDLGKSILKPDYQIEDADFWNQIQKLHDMPEYWDKKGLTALGENKAKTLKTVYAEQ